MLTRLHATARRKNRENGFTLIELLIVVIIIGILAAIALPIFLNQQKAAVDARVQSDVRNTVDNVQTWLVANSGTAEANTGAWVAATPPGAPVITTGNTIGVKIGTDASYQVCGYSANGARFTSATAAYTYDSTSGNFTSGGACVTGSDTGGSTGAQAQGGGNGGTGVTATACTGTYTACYDFNDGTLSGFTNPYTGYSASNATIANHQGMLLTGTNNVGGSGLIYGPKINVTAGKSYTFTASIYLAAGTDAYFKLLDSAGNGNYADIAQPSVTGSWQQVSVTFTAGTGVTTEQPLAQVVSGGSGKTGTAYYDDIKLVQNN